MKQIEPLQKNFMRIIKICIVLFIFSSVYYAKQNGNYNLWEFVKSIFNTNITTSYWYLYLYIGLLCVLPLLQRLAHNMDKRMCEYMLISILSISSLLPILTHYFPEWEIHYRVKEGIFSIYIIYLFVGLYLTKWVKLSTKYAVGSALSFIVGIMTQVLLTYIEYTRTPESYLFYGDITLLPTIVTAMSLFYLVRFTCNGIKNNKIQVFDKIGGATFGIYLIADYIITYYSWMYTMLSRRINKLLAVFVFELFVFVVAGLITSILKRIPLLKRLL